MAEERKRPTPEEVAAKVARALLRTPSAKKNGKRKLRAKNGAARGEPRKPD
jgi:hypothetical protein